MKRHAYMDYAAIVGLALSALAEVGIVVGVALLGRRRGWW